MSFLFIPYHIFIFYLTAYFYKEYIESIIVMAYMSLGLILNVFITLVHNNYFRVLNLDIKQVKYNYITIVGAIIVMLFIYLFKMDYYYFALALSVMTFARFLTNELLLIKRLGIKVKRSIINLFIFSLESTIIIFIANYFLKL